MVAEFKQAHHDKGNGIAALLARPPFLGRRPVFIGDDLTDESGFSFVNTQGGISVRVGPAGVASEAHYRLPDPASVRAELQLLLASLRSRVASMTVADGFASFQRVTGRRYARNARNQ